MEKREAREGGGVAESRSSYGATSYGAAYHMLLLDLPDGKLMDCSLAGLAFRLARTLSCTLADCQRICELTPIGVPQIGNVGDYGLRVYNPATNQHCILPVDVSLNGASFLITVGKEAEQPPYRIENR